MTATSLNGTERAGPHESLTVSDAATTPQTLVPIALPDEAASR